MIKKNADPAACFLLQETNYDGNAAYAQSKLANLMFTIELAPKMQARGVTVNCIHPGVIGTKVLAAFCGQEGDGQSYAEVQYCISRCCFVAEAGVSACTSASYVAWKQAGHAAH